MLLPVSVLTPLVATLKATTRPNRMLSEIYNRFTEGFDTEGLARGEDAVGGIETLAHWVIETMKK